MKHFDIVIIGAGVIGCAVARELSRYNANLCVIDKNSDVCEGTSKANSAIVHAGFDSAIGTNKATMNVDGNKMMDKISEDLDVPFKRNGALVVCTEPDGLPLLEELLQRGHKNGVTDLSILNRDEALAIEPNLSDTVHFALYAKTSGIICPFELTLGFAQNAFANGCQFELNTEVHNIEKQDGEFLIKTSKGEILASAIVNCAGVYADCIHNMVCDDKIKIVPRRGEYCLLDKTAGSHVSKTIFQLPGKLGKGVLVSPTVHGNLIVGPTSVDIDNKEGTCTTTDGIQELIQKSELGVKNLPIPETITSFSGLRAHGETDDFTLGETDCNRFFEAAEIDSPGLSSAPAIGAYLANCISESLALSLNPNFTPIRKAVLHLSSLSLNERTRLIANNPAYGSIVCRCEEVSEGEILDAIHCTLGATTLDGVKRRTRAGMGRCQSGFCSTRVMALLSEHCKIDITEVRKNSDTSTIVVEKIR